MENIPDENGQVMVTRVGLRIPGELTFENWRRAGSKLVRVFDSSVWCLGDWVAYGEKEYADRYLRAIDSVGLEYQTLRNYAWVARRFDLPRRRDTLSFQHHAEVASLPQEEQDRWLDQAEQNKWSRNQLRQHLRASRGANGATSADAVIMPQFRVNRATMQRWRSAAEQASRKLEEWIVECLDSAAGQLEAGELGMIADDGNASVTPPAPRTESVVVPGQSARLRSDALERVAGSR